MNFAKAGSIRCRRSFGLAILSLFLTSMSKQNISANRIPALVTYRSGVRLLTTGFSLPTGQAGPWLKKVLIRL
jgi:hypothetical protein